MRYTISEMAALLGVTTHTLRYYEKMGLIQPEVNRETGYRYYTVTDTRRFNLCRELRAGGLYAGGMQGLSRRAFHRRDGCHARPADPAAGAPAGAQPDEHPLLQKTREYYHTLEQDAGRVWVQNFPEMWRLVLSQEEEAAMTPPCRPKRPSGWSACRRCTGSAACPAG